MKCRILAAFSFNVLKPFFAHLFCVFVLVFHVAHMFHQFIRMFYGACLVVFAVFVSLLPIRKFTLQIEV